MHSFPEGCFFFYPFVKNRKELIKMKKTIKSLIAISLVLCCILSLAACGNKVAKEGAWETATYFNDTELGSGSKTAIVEVKADESSITFTIKTDKETVGDALLEHNLIAGDQSEYGLYVKKVNGIVADYDTDQTYWAFYVNGEYAMTGVDATAIEEGATYKLERTK